GGGGVGGGARGGGGGEGVGDGGVGRDQTGENAGPVLPGAVEHHVLEQMRDAGGAAVLVARACAEEDVGGDHRRRVILVHEDAQAIRQRECLDRQGHGRGDTR